jgi:two-component system sensor histidine kinase ResE
LRVILSWPALRSTLVYVVVGALWIAFSDRVVSSLTSDPSRLTTLQTYKGWGYVGVTAILIYFLLRREMRIAEANLRLKQLNEVKSEFVSNVSHELRTPISNILLYLDLLDQPGRESRQAEYIDTLRRESGRLARLINNLLGLMRLEQGHAELTLEAYALDDLIAEVVAGFKTQAENKSISLHHEPNPDLPAVRGHRQLMNQVLVNLTSNAVAYTPPGGQVRVKSRQRMARGEPYTVIRVHNSDAVIPPEDLPHIFERFYRGKSGRESGSAGTGLGLAICKEVIEWHRGWIEVESSERDGTTFAVWIPQERLDVETRATNTD